jgi:hypothetical protein
MEIAQYSATFDSDLDTMIARCRTVDSRENWAGVLAGGTGPDELYFTMSMRTKSANMTELDILERLSPVVTDGADKVFTTEQRCSWPTGVTVITTEYRFTPGKPNTLRFTYNYETPSPKLVKPKHLPENRQVVNKVVQHYVEKLLAGVPAGR